jgi:hypothetical protein
MAHIRRLPRLGLGAHRCAGTSVRQRGLDGEEAGLDGEVADRWRLLRSSTLHLQKLQQRPESPGTRRRSLTETERLRGREEERRVGIGSSEGVLLLAIDGGFL